MGGSGGGQGRFLPGEQGVQSGSHFFRGCLGRKRPQRVGVRVVGRVSDAGQHRVQLDVLGRALGGELGVFLLEGVLQFLVALGAEQLAEDPAPFFGGSVQQPGELPLRDHGDLGKLVVVQPDELSDGGGDLFRLGHGRAAVGKGEGGVGLFGGEALTPRLGAEIFRVAPDGVPCPAHLEFQLHESGGAGVGVFAAEHPAVPHAAAGAVVQSIGDGVEEGGLACAGVASDEVETAFAETFQLQGGGAGIRAEGRKGQLERSHTSSSFQSVSMSCWQKAVCWLVMGWLFCNS